MVLYYDEVWAMMISELCRTMLYTSYMMMYEL